MTNSGPNAARIFQLVAGHPALDLVNTLDWRFRSTGAEDLLAAPSDLLAFLKQSDLLTAQTARRLSRSDSYPLHSVLDSARALREALADVLYATIDGKRPDTVATDVISDACHSAFVHRGLRMRNSQLIWTWRDNPLPAESAVWLLAWSAYELLTSPAMDKIRACGDPDCRWLFLDLSKSGTRRWCDMKICGNRMKARRFKANR